MRVLINLFLLFVHDYSTKIRIHFYSLIYSFLNCANISYAIFMAALPLYFLCCIHVQYYPYISYTIIYGYMKSLPQYYTVLNLSHRIYSVRQRQGYNRPLFGLFVDMSFTNLIKFFIRSFFQKDYCQYILSWGQFFGLPHTAIGCYLFKV